MRKDGKIIIRKDGEREDSPFDDEDKKSNKVGVASDEDDYDERGSISNFSKRYLSQSTPMYKSNKQQASCKG